MHSFLVSNLFTWSALAAIALWLNTRGVSPVAAIAAIAFQKFAPVPGRRLIWGNLPKKFIEVFMGIFMGVFIGLGENFAGINH